MMVRGLLRWLKWPLVTVGLIDPLTDMPTVDDVRHKKIDQFSHQGKMFILSCYSHNTLIGTINIEVWEEQNLLLIHGIAAETPYQKQGTSMIAWLIKNYAGIIQPVYTLSTGVPFWRKMKKLWPDRISVTNL